MHMGNDLIMMTHASSLLQPPALSDHCHVILVRVGILPKKHPSWHALPSGSSVIT